MLELFKSRKFKYLVVGGANTVFGYAAGVSLYELLTPLCSIWVIGIVSNIFAITFSFVTYKLLVFRTKGQWLAEYLKAYLVYGTMALVGVVLLWLYVDILGLSIWLAQGLVIMSTVILSYMGHARITFRRKN